MGLREELGWAIGEAAERYLQIWGWVTQPQTCPEFSPCSPETTTSTSSSLAPPPTTKNCDSKELGSGGDPSAPMGMSIPITLVLAAATAAITTASSLLIWSVE